MFSELLIYQIKVSERWSVSKQMKGSYKNSYMDSILNYDQISRIQIQWKIYFHFNSFFPLSSHNAYSHSVEHQCPVAHRIQFGKQQSNVWDALILIESHHQTKIKNMSENNTQHFIIKPHYY